MSAAPMPAAATTAAEPLDVVGIGSMVADFLHRVPRVAGVEEKVLLGAHATGETVRRAVGGVTLNHLAWARILGLRAGICGRQADDEVGRFLRAGMDRIGIVRDLELTRGASVSSFAQIFIDPHGGRTIYMCRGTTGETTGEHVRGRHAAFLARAAFVTTEISQLPLDAVVAVCELARANGSELVLDVDVPPSEAVPALGTREQLERALSLATVLKPSRAAAAELAPGSSALALARGLREKYGARAVAITAGEAGCAIVADGCAEEVAAPSVIAVDSTGAGDAFLGGLLVGMRLGWAWPRAARLANCCGAACCEITGAFPDLAASRARVEALLGEPLPLDPIGPIAPGSREGPGRRPSDPVEPFFDVALRELARVREMVGADTLRRAVELIVAAEAKGGRVHVTGVGKPEHVARFVASHFSSVGTPAYFLHATETVHGSAGSVRAGDVVIALSNSGETMELLAAVEALRRIDARIVAVTGRPQSSLGRAADLVLVAAVEDEGGPLGLPPRASILAATMVLCALGAELEARKGVTVDQYKAWHPGGALGAKAARLAAEASARDVETLVSGEPPSTAKGG